MGFVMVIEGEHLILAVGSGKDVGGVTIVALVEFLEKRVGVRQAVVFAGVETQIQPAREVDQSFLPLLGLDGVVNRAGGDEDNHQQNDGQSTHRSHG